MSFEQRAWDYVRKVPFGCVVTYQQVAKAVNSPDASRPAGNAMVKAHAENMDVPWWRVVKKEKKGGSISPGSPGDQRPHDQRRRLEAEGVRFDVSDRIDLGKFGWKP